MGSDVPCSLSAHFRCGFSILVLPRHLADALRTGLSLLWCHLGPECVVWRFGRLTDASEWTSERVKKFVFVCVDEASRRTAVCRACVCAPGGMPTASPKRRTYLSSSLACSFPQKGPTSCRVTAHCESHLVQVLFVTDPFHRNRSSGNCCVCDEQVLGGTEPAVGRCMEA